MRLPPPIAAKKHFAARYAFSYFLLGLALLPGPAGAQAYQAPPAVAVTPEGNSAATVHASMDVAAPPAAVWSALFDCAGAPRFVPGMISCKITGHGPGWETREHRLKGPLFHPVVLNLFRIDFEPEKRLAFRRTGGDWKRSDGEWLLSPIAGGKGTHLTYELHVAIDAPIPPGMFRDGILKGMPKSLEVLRNEAVARAGRH